MRYTGFMSNSRIKNALIVGVFLVICTGVAIGSYVLLSGPDIVDMRSKSEVHISLGEKGFEPARVRVSLGTKIVFSTSRPYKFWPASNPHPSHDLYPEFDPKDPISASSTWDFVIEKSGVWGYHDHIRSYYTGVVYVQ